MIVNRTHPSLKHLKIVVAGDGAVGKSTLCKRLAGTFREGEEQQMTYGVEFHNVSIDHGIGVYGNLWDLGGQEQFRIFQNQFFKAAHIIFLVYSVEWLHSFINLSEWLKFIQNEHPLKTFLIANKIDSVYRVITKEEGMEFAAKHNMKYYEVSALSGIGIFTIKRDITQLMQAYQNRNILY